MEKWDSRPEKPDRAQWAVFVAILVIIAVIIVWDVMV